MGWLLSIFSPSRSDKSSRGGALSSTSEAFALPVSSPITATHPDAFNSDGLVLNEPDSATGPATYSYPPGRDGLYGYVSARCVLVPVPIPLLRLSCLCFLLLSSRSRQSTLLPLHNSPLSPSTPYPPLSHTWARLRAWLSKEYPELGDTLNWGITPEDLAQIEMQFGFSLPAPVRESYLAVDGQEPESSAGCPEGLFFGLQLLPLEDVLDEWRFWRDVDEDPNTGANSRLRELMQSIPPGYVRREYSLRGWIPLASDKAGNYLGVDMNPAESGSPGQVIVFGRDFDTKVVLWKGDGQGGWGKWLAAFVDDLENGEGFEMGHRDHAGSDDSEDDLGYESYFYDGTGRGQGDGGGDGGPTSMRLTGEYRGWSVLEAFAHRSLLKWHEQGLIPDTTVEEKTKVNRTTRSPQS